jgi:predicted DNA-binding transcriptional regulator YafY
MPKSKNADVRIKVIDRCLSDKNRMYTTAEMMDLCNKELKQRDFPLISAPNSIRNDIEQIERMYQPYADVKSYREGRNIYYHYGDPSFSIFSPQLKSDEVAQLTQMVGVLKRFKGMPQFDWLADVTERLGTSLKIDVASADGIVGFDENLDLVGIEHFTPLFNAIIEKRPLQLTYKSFKQEAKRKVIVHPYYLKQYNKRWFLIALDTEKMFLANFALDRIMAIKEAKVPFQPTDIDFFEYFDEMIGVSKDSRTKLQKVKLWVSATQWPYVKTKPLHGTQHTVKVSEDGTIINIEVYLNYELEQLLLSFGENVKVLAPQALKDRISQRLADAVNNYLE